MSEHAAAAKYHSQHCCVELMHCGSIVPLPQQDVALGHVNAWPSIAAHCGPVGCGGGCNAASGAPHVATAATQASAAAAMTMVVRMWRFLAFQGAED